MLVKSWHFSFSLISGPAHVLLSEKTDKQEMWRKPLMILKNKTDTWHNNTSAQTILDKEGQCGKPSINRVGKYKLDNYRVIRKWNEYREEWNIRKIKCNPSYKTFLLRKLRSIVSNALKILSIEPRQYKRIYFTCIIDLSVYWF